MESNIHWFFSLLLESIFDRFWSHLGRQDPTKIDEKSMLEGFDFLFDFLVDFWSDFCSFFFDFDAYLEEVEEPKLWYVLGFWGIYKIFAEAILGCILDSSWLDFRRQLGLRKRWKIKENGVGKMSRKLSFFGWLLGSIFYRFWRPCWPSKSSQNGLEGVSKRSRKNDAKNRSAGHRR